MPPEIYKPSPLERQTELERFQQMNAWVTSRQGWIVSPPGDTVLRVECLPDSALPGELTKAGYRLTPDGTRDRLLKCGITEPLTRTSCGWLEPAVDGSTKPIIERHHAGIVQVERYAFTFAPELEADFGV